MDSLVKDLLDHVIERLDKIQKQQDEQHKSQSERLDTIQNCLERQNQKQNQLDEKLLTVTSTLEKEKEFMRDQLREAQDVILARLIDVQEQSKSKPHERLFVLTDEMKETLNSGFEKMTETIENTVKSLTRAELIWLDNQTDNRLREVSSTMNENMQDVRTELNALAGQIDKKMDSLREGVCETVQQVTEQIKKEIKDEMQKISTDLMTPGITTAVREMLENLESTTEKHVHSTVEKSGSEMKAEMLKFYGEQTQAIKKHVDATVQESVIQLKEVANQVKHEVITVTEKECGLVKNVLNDVTSQNNKMKTKILESYEEKTEDIKQHMDSVAQDTKELVDSAVAKITTELKQDPKQYVDSAVQKVTTELKQIKTELVNVTARESRSMTKQVASYNTATSDMKKELLKTFTESSQDTKKHVETQVKQATDQMKENMYKTKNEIFLFAEKEAQLVRDRIAGPLPGRKNYVFDMYIENFQTMIKSGKEVYSPPWHVNEFMSSVKGKVSFCSSSKMNVWVVFGHNPRMLGLQPRSGVKLKIIATITDIHHKKLPNKQVGEETWTWDENQENISNLDMGWHLGEMSCDDLKDEGYGDKEGYRDDALLIRYKVEVL